MIFHATDLSARDAVLGNSIHDLEGYLEIENEELRKTVVSSERKYFI